MFGIFLDDLDVFVDFLLLFGLIDVRVQRQRSKLVGKSMLAIAVNCFYFFSYQQVSIHDLVQDLWASIFIFDKASHLLDAFSDISDR